MDETELKILVEQIASFGDEKAFRQLFVHYYDKLFYFSNSFVKSREAAEEIVQDVFISIWGRRDKLARINNLGVYLYVAVKNLSINYLNRSGSPYTDLNQLDVSLPSVTASPEDLLVASEMLQAINRCIAQLPPKCRMVYKLVKEDGLRYKEVAEILHISPRTVENQIGAALRKIAADIRIDFKTLSFQEHKQLPLDK
jgi:RNA polymerase sigma-70 factor (ECF subfamily)